MKNLSDLSHEVPYEGSRPTTFAFKADEKLPVMLNGDVKQVTEIFNHLFSNALQYVGNNPTAWNVCCERQKDDRLSISSDIPVIIFKTRASRENSLKGLGFNAVVHTPERLSISIPVVFNGGGKYITKFFNHLLSKAFKYID